MCPRVATFIHKVCNYGFFEFELASSRAMQEQLPRVISIPFQLRYLFARYPEAMSQALAIVSLEVERRRKELRMFWFDLS